MRVTELLFALITVLAHIATYDALVVRNRHWVEQATAPLITKHRGHHMETYHNKPITQAFTHMNLRASPTKMTTEHKKPSKSM